MIRRPPRSTLDRSSAASDVYKRQESASDIPTTDEGGLPGFHMTLWSGLWVAKGTPKAVSYTHLRAHETVLDLVCRLLLEKKNKHTAAPTCILDTQHDSTLRDTTLLR